MQLLHKTLTTTVNNLENNWGDACCSSNFTVHQYIHDS